MAISGVAMFVGYAFSYLVVYKKSKIMGNLLFLALSIGMLSGSTSTEDRALSMALFGGALISIILDIAYVLTGKRPGASIKTLGKRK